MALPRDRQIIGAEPCLIDSRDAHEVWSASFDTVGVNSSCHGRLSNSCGNSTVGGEFITGSAVQGEQKDESFVVVHRSGSRAVVTSTKGIGNL